MKKIEKLRTNLPGDDFLWATRNRNLSVIPGKPISPGKTHMFDESVAVGFNGQGLSCLFCAKGIKRVNFGDGEIMIKAQWDAATSQNMIKLDFKPAPGKKILGVGAQYAVNAVRNKEKCPFTAKLIVSDDTDEPQAEYETLGETTISMDNSAIFLGAEITDPLDENISSVTFTVTPIPSDPILGFYINSLRLRIG